jgi:hypothetical protein
MVSTSFAAGVKALAAAVSVAVAAAVVTAAPAQAGCEDPGQSPCTGLAPTTDQVVAIMAELTDPGRPAMSKTDIVTPGFSPNEAGPIDDDLNQTNADGLLPYTFVVTDIQPAPNNFAGVTVTVAGSFNQRSA